MTLVLPNRFTQTDPMPMGGGSFEGSYAHARNNPAMFVDPLPRVPTQR
jgi:hypothetical protein